MRLVACVNFYQDAEMLRRFLPDLRRKVDYLVCVDGRYTDFPEYDSPQSTDGSIEVVAKYADLFIGTPRNRFGIPIPWEDEIAKRTSYLVGQPGDWYLVVDADEEIEGIPDRDAIASRPDWLVGLKRVGDATQPYGIHRCFAHRPGLRYHGAHHAVHVLGQIIHPDRIRQDWLPGVTILHHQMERDAERVERKGEYYAKLAPSERVFRQAVGLGGGA